MRIQGVVAGLCLCLGSALGMAQDLAHWQFLHNGPEAPTDHRYDYHWRVLAAALEATRDDYGDYTMAPSDYMNESRQVVEMKKPNGMINTLVLDSTSELERDLIAVPVPVDKGLLGYRVFLIRSEDQARFSAVHSLEDLRKFTIGQGSDWSDVAIYRASGFTVVGGSSYEGLFGMLMAKRFDAFGRGVTEVVEELVQQQSRFPKMAIEKDLLLYYPMPVYFWFPKTATGALHAKRVTEGMHRLVGNGQLDRLFKQEFGPLVTRLQLGKRRLFRIPNPDLPPNQPFANKQLWFDLGK